MATLHSVNAVVQSSEGQQGTTPMSEVKLEGTSVSAMIDTGLPVTTVSLEFLL